MNQREVLKRLVRTSIQYDHYVNSDIVDDAVERLLSSNQKEAAARVKRGDATLRKIGSVDDSLTQEELTHLVNDDYPLLAESLIIGDGFKEAFADASPILASGNITLVKQVIAEVVPHDETYLQKRSPITINGNEIDFSVEKTFNVMSNATKFIVPVPAFADGGEPLVYPQGHVEAGKPILDWEKKPIGEKGIVFANRKESLAAARGDGSAVMIINNVKPQQAQKLKAKVAEYTTDPALLTLEQLKSVLSYARDELGLTDIYNSDHTFIAKNMTPVGDAGKNDFGSYKRDARDIVKAIYVVGDGVFKGSSHAASGEQAFGGGALVIKDANGEMRLITRQKALGSYVLPDGTSLEHTFDVAEMGAALAKSHEEFGLQPGEMPMKDLGGNTVGTPVSGHIVSADGFGKHHASKFAQGAGKSWVDKRPDDKAGSLQVK